MPIDLTHEAMSANEAARPADAVPATWVDRFAPVGMRPYLRLTEIAEK